MTQLQTAHVINMGGSLNLPFPMLSDPDRSISIEPYGLMNEEDPRGLAIPATVVIDPNGEEILRLVRRDFADRPFERVALETLRHLDLAPVEQSTPTLCDPASGPRAMPYGDLRAYFRGAKFGSTAMGLRTGATAEADRSASSWITTSKMWRPCEHPGQAPCVGLERDFDPEE